MSENNLELIGTVLLFIFGLTMIYQGHLIFHGKYGYRHCEREQRKSEDTRRRIEKLLKDK
ncbi:MAG: hypothetical protein CM15mV24_1340 [Bellamyvirus sp.]|nr:MAG: hypothetical protein CM15mV24_1340 [Bellamyvirus sp.]